MNDDVQLRRAERLELRRRTSAAHRRADRIARQFEKPHQLAQIIPRAQIGGRQPEEVDASGRPRRPPGGDLLHTGAGGFSVARGEHAAEPAAVKGGDAGKSHAARDAPHIVADEPRRAAVFHREQGGRRVEMRRKRLADVLLRAEHDGVIVELR